jgi:hypothetical protein
LRRIENGVFSATLVLFVQHVAYSFLIITTN